MDADPTIAEGRARAKLEFYGHVIIYLVVMAVLIGVNLSTSPTYYWFVWPLVGWGIGLVWHGLGVFGSVHRSRLYQRMVDREMRRSHH